MTNAAESARARLAETGRAKDRSRRLATIFIVTGLFLAALLLVALLDYWLMLPIGPRWAALAGLFLLAGGGVWQIRRLWRQPTDLKEAALDVEAARPELGCEVSTAAEYLTGERPLQRDYEPELVAALQSRAAAAVAAGGPSYGSRVRRPALIAVSALGFVAAFLIAVPGAWTALWRTVTPWSRAHFTQVEVIPGSVDIPVGQSLVISNRFSGRAIAAAEIEVKEEGSDAWQRHALTGDTNGVFRFEAGTVRRSFAYRVRGGDAISDEFAITAYIPPAVQHLTLGTTPPAYTGLPAVRQTTADATVLRGTRARFEIQPNVPLSKARLHFTNDAVVELTLGPQGRWEGEVPVTKDMDFAIELLDAKGRGGKPTRHHITALPDEAPKLDIVDPGQDMRADATNTIPLRIRGADDFGITRVRLVFHRLGSPEQELQLQPVLGTNHSFEAAASLALDPLKLSLYDIVAYHAEAVDNNTLDGPGVGRSPVYFIEITNEGGGPKPKSKPKPGEKVNLLTVQKQIISDTASIAPAAGAPPYDELALRQNDAVAFGRLYQESLMAAGAPVAAQAALEDALKSMQSAASDLGTKNRSEALRKEEQALASLYQVLKNTPTLAKLMEAPPKKEDDHDKPKPPKVNVVVQAMEKKSKEDPNKKELEAMLNSMKELAQRQSALTKQLTDPARGESQPDATTPPTDPSAAAAAAPGEAAKSPGSPASPSPTGEQASAPAQPKPESAKETAAANAEKETADAKPEASPEAETADAESKADQESPQEAALNPPGQGKGEAKSATAAKAKGKGKSKAKGKGKGQGEGQGQGEGDGQAMAKAEKSEQSRDSKERPKNSEKASAKNGNGKAKGKGQTPGSQQASAKNPSATKAEPGEKPESANKSDPSSQPAPSQSEPLAQEAPPALEAMAPQQEQLSQEAREMAERLQRLAGKGMRTGQGISRQVSQAAQQMDRAAHALRQGNAQSAAGAGDQGSAAMNGAITLLERVIAGRPEVNDVASEEAPKQYEGAISEYFRRLSRAE